jgi:hypothetical protein
MTRQINVPNAMNLGLSIWRMQECYTSVLASLFVLNGPINLDVVIMQLSWHHIRDLNTSSHPIMTVGASPSVLLDVF